jgi:hypothetical protein
MATNDPYATLEEFKAWLGRTDTGDDAVLGDCLAAASRAVDRATDRVFYQQTATRTYTAEESDWLPVDDLVSVSSLQTDVDGDRIYETTWSATDFDLAPDNAGLRYEPYTTLRTVPYHATFWFPTTRKGVRIAGTWGWPAVPDAVHTATLILAHKLLKRQDSPLGVQAIAPDAPAVVIRAMDPDVTALLAPYRRLSLVMV